VRRSPIRFRNIVISLVDTWAASSAGALSLSENSLYTVEAFRDFLEHLEPDGTLLVNRWDREFDRLLALGAAGLRSIGAEQPSNHLFACGHSNSTALLVKRTPLTPDEIARLRANCEANRFYEVFAPDRQGSPLRRALAGAGDPGAIARNAAVDLSAPTDDRPFFFYSIPTRRFAKVVTDLPTLEKEQAGLLTLIGLLVTSTALAMV